MGQMSPLACDASIDFARFANEHGCTLYFWEFLKQGFQALPDNLQQRFAGLKHWNGVGSLKHDLRRLASTGPNNEVLLAGRSATLMHFGAKLFTGPCRNVLVTDNCWPSYRHIMEREFQRSDCRITTIAIRRKVFRENIDADALAELLTREFQRQRCDGLFLPLVDNLGVRMPVEQIVNRIRETCELRFVAIDGAQAIGHVPLDLDRNYCDLFIAGTHKWLRAFHGMGIGFAPNPGSQSYITNSLKRWQEDGSLNDPLLAFSKELECNQESPIWRNRSGLAADCGFSCDPRRISQ